MFSTISTFNSNITDRTGANLADGLAFYFNMEPNSISGNSITSQASYTSTVTSTATPVTSTDRKRGSTSLSITSPQEYNSVSTQDLTFSGVIGEGFSISIWFKTSVSGDNTRLVYYGSLPLFLTTGNKIAIYTGYVFYGGAPGTSYNNNQWNHVCITFTVTSNSPNMCNMRMYYNNVIISTVAFAGNTAGYPNASSTLYPPLYEPREFIVGGGGVKFTGLLDEYRFYNRVLSASEVATLYNNTF